MIEVIIFFLLFNDFKMFDEIKLLVIYELLWLYDD